MLNMWSRLFRVTVLGLLLVVGGASLTFSGPRVQDEQDKARLYTPDIEFEYLSWMFDAALAKARSGAVGLPGYLDREAGRIVVSDYLQSTQDIIRAEDALNRIYSDPSYADKEASVALIRAALPALYSRQNNLAPAAEAVLQAQVADVAAELGLAFLGQPIPEVLYHSTSVPDALIVSPRNEIRQAANISITPGLPIEQQAALEKRVEAGLGESALVVPIGGVGVYPTMIMRTTDRRWLVSTIAHEWTHNFLELRPLGLLYDHTPELRTMNETTADIVGNEIGDEVMRRFYSEHDTVQPPGLDFVSLPLRYPDPHDADPPPFDFRAEMHATRVTVDLLLASGKIGEAEQYMERRRRQFVTHGYYIRRLNQAYFAFYGAYADVPGGASGTDPVGPAVRALRARSASLADFVNTISWMTSFEQLQATVGS